MKSLCVCVLQLTGHDVPPRHCVIAHTEGIVTVTPAVRDAETFVDNHRIYETTILQHGMIVRFGRMHAFRFGDPNVEEVNVTIVFKTSHP